MCGRFTLKTPPAELAAALALVETPPDLGARYNIAPSLDVLTIRNLGERRAEALRWGLVPRWARDPSIGNRLANARAETLSLKPSFRDAFRRRRGIVLADGFYEWRTEPGGGKTPFWFHMADEAPFALAALWDVWQPVSDAPPLVTCCLVTTEANGVVGPVHDRMPVILAGDDLDHWLDPRPAPAEHFAPLLRPFSDAPMRATPVSRYVNSTRNEGPRCLDPAEPVNGWLL